MGRWHDPLRLLWLVVGHHLRLAFLLPRAHQYAGARPAAQGLRALAFRALLRRTLHGRPARLPPSGPHRAPGPRAART